MPDVEQPQLYLISPTDLDLSPFSNTLSGILDEFSVACFRLNLASHDEDRIVRVADTLRQICHDRDVPIVINSHMQMVERLGLDGVHLPDGLRNVRTARKALGADAIVGAFSGTSRHDGMGVAEAGADYVSFGPVAPSPLGDGSYAEQELFGWWSEMIEVPVVAEGGLNADAVSELADVTDFFGIGEEIWNSDDPQAALSTLLGAMKR